MQDKSFKFVLRGMERAQLTLTITLPKNIKDRLIDLAFVASSAEAQGAFSEEMRVQIIIEAAQN